MLFFKAVLLFAASASAFILDPRVVQDVLDDLAMLNKDTKALNTAVTQWDGTINGAVPILNQADKLDNDIKSGTTTCSKQPKFKNPGSKKIIAYIKQPLIPSIQAVINSLKKRKADADKAGITPTVLNELKTIRADTADLVTCLEGKASSGTSASAKKVGNQVLAILDSGIKAYGG